MLWYHISNEFIGYNPILEPRVPIVTETALISEGNIPRVCVSNSIYFCIRSKVGREDLRVCDILDQFSVTEDNENYIIENKIMARFTFTKEDFYSEEPYAFVFSYASDRFRHDLEMNKMAEEAKKAGYTGFKKSYQAYLKSLHLKNAANVDRNNPSDFPDQPIELECGQWLCDANGVKTVDGTYGTVQACCHPIMPVERLVNIDTFEETVNLAFYKSKRWRNIIVSKEITAVASKITNLAARGIAVTSENAKALVKYLCDIENINLEIIPEHECHQDSLKEDWYTQNICH